MKKRDVEKAIRKVFDSYMLDAHEKHGEKTDECPSLPRMRELVLNPESQSPEEKRHIASGCEYCGYTIERMEKEVWHPNPMELFLFRLGKYQGEKKDLIRDHIQKDMCLRCLRIEAAARKVKTISVVLRRAAEGAVEEARARLRGLAWGLSEILPMPSDLALFAGAVRTRGSVKTVEPPLSRTIFVRQSEDGSLRCSLEMNPGGFLELKVLTDSPRLGGAMVRFELNDIEMQKQGLSGYAILAPREGGLQWEAVVRLPSISEVLRQLGAEGWYVFAFAVHPDELTVEDGKELRESILRILKGKTAETNAWITWMDDVMANAALPEALKALIGELRKTLIRH